MLPSRTGAPLGGVPAANPQADTQLLLPQSQPPNHFHSKLPATPILTIHPTIHQTSRLSISPSYSALCESAFDFDFIFIRTHPFSSLHLGFASSTKAALCRPRLRLRTLIKSPLRLTPARHRSERRPVALENINIANEECRLSSHEPLDCT